MQEVECGGRVPHPVLLPQSSEFLFGGGGEEGGISPCSSSNSYYDMILQVVGMSLTYT